MQADDEGPAGKEGDDGAGEPVRVHQVGLLGRPAKRADHREDEQERQPGPPLDACDNAASVASRQAVVAIRARADDLDLDASRPQVLDGVEHEPAGEVGRHGADRRS